MPKRKNAVTVRYADGRTEVKSPAAFVKPSRREELRRHRRSKHWRAIRKQALERDEHRCVACRGTEKLEVHHLTYVRLGAELLADVITLCQRCHATEHAWKRLRPHPR